MNKSELRNKYLEIRKNIDDKEEKSSKIFETIINTKEYKESNIIALYKALESEVNTDRLINHSLNLGKVVCLPRVQDDNLIFYSVNSVNDNLEKSKFGIEEPSIDESKEVNPDLIDLVIVPGVAFDKSCNRLGFGKGYYDRFLQNSNLNTIGICFDEQIVDEGILVDKYDVKMDTIISQDRTIVKNNYVDIKEIGM